MADIKQAYAASSAVTITLASLASSSSLLVGRASTAIDNTANLYLDYLLAGLITTGTTPTVSTSIEVWVVAMRDDSTWPDSITGTDAAKTFIAEVKAGVCRLAAQLTVTATSNVGYPFGPVSVANLFGGVCPKKFLVFVTHSTAVNLNATGTNHVISVTPCYATST
jgi:hypothetical protein